MGNSKSSLPYDVKDFVCTIDGPCNLVLHNGKRVSDGETVTVFRFDKKNATPVQKSIADNFVTRLKTFKHPNVVAFCKSYHFFALEIWNSS